MSAGIAAVALLLAFGCDDGAPAPPPPSPDASSRDAAVAFRDTDGDGLCDSTELGRGTDPTVPDSDMDGLTDRTEVDFGYQPTRPDSPARDVLVFLSETEGATAQHLVTRTVRGEGENYTGAFEGLAVLDRLDLTAADFYVDSVAVAATPSENVFEVVPEEERFYGVLGRTLLAYEVRFAFGDNVPRSCARAYPFRYQIKRSDGTLVYLGRFLLVVLPAGQRLDTTDWCVPEGGCI